MAATGVSAVWLSRYAVAVHRLTRGIGDTIFYGADGQPGGNLKRLVARPELGE